MAVISSTGERPGLPVASGASEKAVPKRWAGGCRAVFVSLFLVTGLGGCTYLDDLGLTFGDLFAFPEPPESEAMLIAPSPPPKYQFGDTFVFEDDGSMVEERVIAIDGPLVVWENSRGQQWTTKANPILPPVSSEGITRTFSLNADRIFPLSRGLKFRYVVTEQTPQSLKKTRKTQSCEVTAMPLITVRAGSFDTYEIFCNRGGYTETLYYAPKANNVILTISKTPSGEKVRELMSYVKGSAAALARGPRLISPDRLPTIPQALPQPITQSTLYVMPQGTAKPAVTGAPAGPGKAVLDDPFAGISPPLASLIRRMDDRIRALEMSAGPAGKTAEEDGEMEKNELKERTGASPSAVSGYAIQLGAYKTQGQARRAWETSFALAAADILSTLSVQFDTYRAKNGARLVRVLVGDFTSRRQAKNLCDRIKDRKLDCWVIKPGA